MGGRLPSQGFNVWPRELNGFISLGADRVCREERRMKGKGKEAISRLSFYPTF